MNEKKFSFNGERCEMSDEIYITLVNALDAIGDIPGEQATELQRKAYRMIKTVLGQVGD